MQRQLAIQRLQEQEKERQMRLEQQKHTIQMRAQMPAFSLPYAQVHTVESFSSCLDSHVECFAIDLNEGLDTVFITCLWE